MCLAHYITVTWISCMRYSSPAKNKQFFVLKEAVVSQTTRCVEAFFKTISIMNNITNYKIKSV